MTNACNVVTHATRDTRHTPCPSHIRYTDEHVAHTLHPLHALRPSHMTHTVYLQQDDERRDEVLEQPTPPANAGLDPMSSGPSEPTFTETRREVRAAAPSGRGIESGQRAHVGVIRYARYVGYIVGSRARSARRVVKLRLIGHRRDARRAVVLLAHNLRRLPVPDPPLKRQHARVAPPRLIHRCSPADLWRRLG